MRVEQLTWATWEPADPGTRALWIEEAAESVGGIARAGAIEVRGVTLVLVPGGLVQLGWDGTTTALDDARRAEWDEAAGFDGSFETFLRTYLGPARRVHVSPFLIEPSAVALSEIGIDPYDEDPERVVRDALERTGFRLPSNDEWEVAMRAGVGTLFSWGDVWPDGAGPSSADPYRGSTTFTAHAQANALSIVPRTNPYETEIVAEHDWLRGGDGGVAVCGGRPAPEAWYSFALSFQLPRELWGDLVSETFEQAFVRRTLSLDAAPR